MQLEQAWMGVTQERIEREESMFWKSGHVIMRYTNLVMLCMSLQYFL